MEALQALEQKVVQLIDLIKKLKAENDHLMQQNMQLQKKLEELELTVLHSKEQTEEEKTFTKDMVDDLIKSIDSLVGNEDIL